MYRERDVADFMCNCWRQQPHCKYRNKNDKNILKIAVDRIYIDCEASEWKKKIYIYKSDVNEQIVYVHASLHVHVYIARSCFSGVKFQSI